MERQYIHPRNLKRTAVLAIVGFALAVLSYKLAGETAEGCNLLSAGAWFVLQVLHPVLWAGWQSVQVYLYDGSGFLQHLPHVVPSIWSLLCFVVG
jgi:hypothetical protein